MEYRKFDDQYPLFDPRIKTTSVNTERGISIPNPRFYTEQLSRIQAFLRAERLSIIEIFRNTSPETREWSRKYEKLLSDAGSAQDIHKELEVSGALGTRRYQSLNELPDQFYRLADAESFEALTIDKLHEGISKYRDALQTALKVIGETPARTDLSTSKKLETLRDADTISSALILTSNQQNAELQNLENSIAASARALYGDKVGSSSFTYLLIVFAAVFVVIMLVPRFYDNAVAVNILKAEFLLQFSTVFVLVAAIIILGIGGLIDHQQLPVLLAGISGYVLGQLGKTS